MIIDSVEARRAEEHALSAAYQNTQGVLTELTNAVTARCSFGNIDRLQRFRAVVDEIRSAWLYSAAQLSELEGREGNNAQGA